MIIIGKIIRTGVLKKKTKEGYEKKKYLMKLIGTDYLSEIINLQDIVVSHLNLPEIFQTDNREFFKEEIKKGGRIIGVFTENQLVAYRFVTFPKGDSMNLGVDLGISKKELNKVAHLESTIVHPDYRGNGLQRKTLYVALDLFSYLDYNHICSTISPKNYHSLKNIMSGGLVIKKLREKYGGKLRYILYRDLKNIVPKEYIRTIEVDDIQVVREEKLFEKGFEGYQAFKNNDNYGIKFGSLM